MYVYNLLILEIMKTGIVCNYGILKDQFRGDLHVSNILISSRYATSYIAWFLAVVQQESLAFFHSSSGTRGGKHRLDLYLTITSFPLGTHVWTTTDFWPCGILQFPAHMWNFSKLWSLRVERVTGRLLWQLKVIPWLFPCPAFCLCSTRYTLYVMVSW